MNTGKALETKRLVLVPGNNARDDEPFINMLRNDGNFRDFCGIEFSEKYLAEFRNYFERTGHDECIYSIFLKGSDRFIGYVGFHRERNSDYQIEFYISKSERRKGYATAMIGLALEKCKELGINKVLMTCDKTNIGSAKSITNNGGVLESEFEEDGVVEQRYWITLVSI